MHSFGYAHLDIKPLNILFDENYNIRLADFGTIEEDIYRNGLSNWRKGTEKFMAPEVKNIKKIRKPYNMYKADVYSLGVTLYAMLTLKYPFQHKDKSSDSFASTNYSGESKNSLSQDYESPFQVDDVEEKQSVMNLLSLMLHPDPSMRPTCEEIFSHPWMTDSSLDIRNDEVYTQVATGIDPFITHNTVTF